MGLSTSGRTWDAASSPAASRLVRRFESAWREAPHRPPDVVRFLPDDPEQRPGALLALLRADLTLRREGDEPVSVEWYHDRFPELDDDALVALIYEEFCLREEAGETPDPAEYHARFPDLSAKLRRVLDIHGLIGAGHSTALHLPEPPEVPFPEAGQTIAGFRLVEELGRGSFARVFRAEERQLADRPVALKVARTGSREPRTLARLQHTHIVPVHSYRTDPATGLHLLCMPYFGRLTLARVLDDPAARSARTGAELVAALDRLEPSGGIASVRPAGKLALARRNYPQAIAWWGARLAEGLQHAHDRGVFHRDVKPSNVLVTADGMPMLLDFNLAQGSPVDDPDLAPTLPGGTLAYMAPENLEGLLDGKLDPADVRSDLYSLGVVLFEALGSRPFTVPTGTISMSETLARAAEDRRAGAPSLMGLYPEVPPALDAVVRKCLAPEPSDRYESAADLAVDLQAVADDGPLRFAREPEPSRTFRWLRRHRWPIALAVPLIVALAVVAHARSDARVARVQLKTQVEYWFHEGTHSEANGHLRQAADQFEMASRLAEGHPELIREWHRARERHGLALEKRTIRGRADTLFECARPLWFQLLGFGGAPAALAPRIESALRPFYVLRNPEWARLSDLTLLDEPRRSRLLDEVDDLLFLWVLASDRPADPGRARWGVSACDRALAFARPEGPWRALRARFAARLGEVSRPPSPDRPEDETSVLACREWGLLRDLEGRPDAAIAWLERATQLKPDDDRSQFALGKIYDRAGQPDRALEHYGVAIALDPNLPWPRAQRARLYQVQGRWDRALEDLLRARKTARGNDLLRLNFQVGLVSLRRGIVAQIPGPLRRSTD